MSFDILLIIFITCVYGFLWHLCLGWLLVFGFIFIYLNVSRFECKTFVEMERLDPSTMLTTIYQLGGCIHFNEFMLVWGCIIGLGQIYYFLSKNIVTQTAWQESFGAKRHSYHVSTMKCNKQWSECKLSAVTCVVKHIIYWKN